MEASSLGAFLCVFKAWEIQSDNVVFNTIKLWKIIKEFNKTSRFIATSNASKYSIISRNMYITVKDSM